MSRYREQHEASFPLWGVAVYVAVVFGSAYGAAKLVPAGPQFSPLQNMDALQRDYKDCKAQAPVGFDCVLVPIVVSEDYMRNE